MVKKIIFVTAVVLLSGSLFSGAHAYQATPLSDHELDNIYAGGFDFNLSAAYAFRAAVINQSNIVAVTSRGGNINNITVNSSNYAKINSQIGVASQENISALIAKSGDIMDAAINNSNCSKNSSALAVTQTNVAVVVALAGDVKDTIINNLNLSQNALQAVETNIAVVVAGGDIENSQIVNANNVQIGNVVLPDSQIVNIPSLSNDVVARFNFDHSLGAVKTNLSIVVSGFRNRPFSSFRDLDFEKIVNSMNHIH